MKMFKAITKQLSWGQKKAQHEPRVDCSKEMLQKYDRNALKYVYDIVTGDEM